MGGKIQCEYNFKIFLWPYLLAVYNVRITLLQEECGVFNCELSSDEEDGAYLNKPPAPGKYCMCMEHLLLNVLVSRLMLFIWM